MADRERRRIAGPLAGALVLCAAFIALGIWQVHRLAWKEALIARVNRHVYAAPVNAPGPAQWPGLTLANSQYLHVSATGHFEQGRNTLVKAVTNLGAGFWLMTPFDDARGFTVLVNRGYVPDRKAGDAPAPTGQRTITGLLRESEPGGAFLQSNQPRANRWFSRDVAAIARARHLANVAPYFIDEAAGESPKGGPVGGLTVIHFPNNHLVYALTWFALAIMSLAAAAWLIRERFAPKKG